MGKSDSTKELPPGDQMYTPQQVAQRLGFSRKTVYRMIAAGRIRAIKFSRKAIRVSASELHRLITEADVTKRV